MLNCRKVCRSRFLPRSRTRRPDPSNPFDFVRAPRTEKRVAADGRSPTEAKLLIVAAQPLRLGAAVTLLFVQDARVSEVLGLAWEDLNLDAGTAHTTRHHLHEVSGHRARSHQDLRRQGNPSSRTNRSGSPMPAPRPTGRQASEIRRILAVSHLRRRQTVDGLTTTLGGLVNRQSVIKEIDRAGRPRESTGLVSAVIRAGEP